MNRDKSAENISGWDHFFVHNPAARHRRRLIHRLIADRFIAEKGRRLSSILDVGCGDGRLLEEVGRSRDVALFGIEPGRSSAADRLGKRLSGLYSIDISRERLPRSFDLILCTEVLEHVVDDASAAANLLRMCSGTLLVTVPAGPLLQTDLMMGHVRHYTVESLESLLSNAGFKTVRCFTWGWPFHSLYRALLNLLPDRTTASFGNKPYGVLQILVCRILYGLFFFNLRGMGRQIIYIGVVK